MPYGSSGKLPSEAASKLGHINVIQSEWIKSLVDDFESRSESILDVEPSAWIEFEPSVKQELPYIWAADGSFVPVKTSPPFSKEVAFVKTALIYIDKNKLNRIDKKNPHPLLLQDIMSDSALYHSTVLPLRNIRTSKGSNYNAIRNIIFDSMKIDENGAYFQTLKWLSYKKWTSNNQSSPSFSCPHCSIDIPGLSCDSDKGACPNCGNEVFLTDMIGFHLDMGEESAPDSIASSYMLIMETLMLFTVIRLLWDHSDKTLLSKTLFIKDGPMTLRSQYSKLVPLIREFIEYAKLIERPLHIVSQEKTGIFVDHLNSICRCVSPKTTDENPRYFVLSHSYVRDCVYRMPDLNNPYGLRTNWGEKIFVKYDPDTSFVLNIPTGQYNRSADFPTKDHMVGLGEILSTLPSLISRKYENALFPIELANGIASMSSYPSAKILERFLENRT